MSLQRLESLEVKHANIETMISEIETASYVDAAEVRRLKKEKLKIKEEMASLAEFKQKSA
jgi:hypothetical protein